MKNAYGLKLKQMLSMLFCVSPLLSLFGCSGNDYIMSRIDGNKATSVGIGELSPSSGSVYGKTRVKVKGANFVEGKTLVYFDDYEADEITLISSEEMEVTTPTSDRDETNKVDVRVVVSLDSGDVEGVLKEGFTYLGDAAYCEDSEDGECRPTCESGSEDESCLMIDSIEPDSMYYNESNEEKRKVLITGENFSDDGLRVTIGSLELNNCSVQDGDGEEIECTVPKVSDEEYSSLISVGDSKDVMVEANDESGEKMRAIKSKAFTFEDPDSALAPTITKIDPAQGYYDSQETEVTITGTNFLLEDDQGDSLTQVYFDGVAAKDCEVDSSTSIVCIPPTSTRTGPVPVKVVVMYDDINRTVELENGYTYLGYDGVDPTISEVTPAEGYADEETPITIKGTNFVADQTYVVFVDDKDETELMDCEVNGAGTEISCKAPTSSIIGLVDVQVEIEVDGMTRSANKLDAFKYLERTTTSGDVDEDVVDDDEDDSVEEDDGDDDEDSVEEDDDDDDEVTITRIEPNTGRVNTKTSFVVWGTGFNGQKNKTKVKIGGQNSSECVVTKSTDPEKDDQVACKTPKIKKSKSYNVKVVGKRKNKKGKWKEYKAVEKKGFSFTEEDDQVEELTITKIEPNIVEAMKRTTFKVYGTGFKKKKKMTVQIGESTAACDKVKRIKSDDDESGADSENEEKDEGGEKWIRCKTPKLSAGVYDVTVSVKGNGTKTVSEGMTYSSAEEYYNDPTISSISPSSASSEEKTEFKIKGTEFSKTVKVSFGEGSDAKEADCKTPKLAKDGETNKSGANKEDVIKCTTPKLKEGEYTVTVEVTHNKKDKNSKVKKSVVWSEKFKITVDEEAKAPEITSVSPASAEIKTKTEFVIQGLYFNKKKTNVKIGGKSADCEDASKTGQTDTTSGSEIYSMTCKTPKIEYASEYDLIVKKRYTKNGKQQKVETTWDQKFDITEKTATSGSSDDDKDPVIESITPNSAKKKEKVEFTIIGENFREDSTKVKIDGKDATKCKVSENYDGTGKDSVTCKSPKINKKGEYAVKVIVTKNGKQRRTTLLRGFKITD